MSLCPYCLYLFTDTKPRFTANPDITPVGRVPTLAIYLDFTVYYCLHHYHHWIIVRRPMWRRHLTAAVVTATVQSGGGLACSAERRSAGKSRLRGGQFVYEYAVDEGTHDIERILHWVYPIWGIWAWMGQGDGQTEAEGIQSQDGRGDALLRRMPPYLTYLTQSARSYGIQKMSE